ncbi:MAG: ATP-binding protein [Gammaproteobacteria bacterium]|nr:ATP-binding protein [Gammaproteobacteria bacterium]
MLADATNPFRRERRFLAVIAVGLLCIVLFVVRDDGFLFLAALFTSSLMALLLAGLFFYRQRSALHRLRESIQRAQEGLLEPVMLLPTSDPQLRQVTVEYNRMIVILHKMFSTVEECQARVLGERNKIDAILQSLPGALLHIADDLQISGVNKTAEELFGLPQGQLLGKNLFHLLTLNETDREVLRDAFLYKHPLRNQEITVPLKGAAHWLSMNLAFLNERETDMGAVITVQDITEYRQLQDSVAIREKLVAMGQLAAGVAHELNTPLGNILGYSQLLREAAGTDEKLIRYASVVGDETKRCSRIVHDLLNYARRDPCSGETCDITQFIRELIDTFITCRLKRYSIRVELDLPPGELLLEGGCGQLDIVLTNLILNAIQALAGVDEPRIRLAARDDGNGFVTVVVEDNGPGIAAELRSRIFDPFFTTKEVGEGSGLGLSICQAMMVRHGGYVRYDSDFSGGARFVLRLPGVNPGRVVHECSDACDARA